MGEYTHCIHSPTLYGDFSIAYTFDSLHTSRKVTFEHQPKHQEGHLAKLKAPRYSFTILLVPHVLMGTRKLPKKKAAYEFCHLCQLRAPTKFCGCLPNCALVLRSHFFTSDINFKCMPKIPCIFSEKTRQFMT
jgi:hypothetical protein